MCCSTYSAFHVTGTTPRVYFSPTTTNTRDRTTRMAALTNNPTPGSSLTDVEIAEILTLHRDGHTERDIGSIIHRSKTAVHDALQTYNFETFVTHNPRAKRPKKTTEWEDRYLLQAAKQFNEVPLRDISKIVNVPVSKSTVSRRLHEVGYGRYIALQKPHLSPQNIQERLE